nr:hypothetical protein [Tanacetum cinerariifolium]
MFQICPKIPGQKFVDPSFEEEILAFLSNLGYPGNIKTLYEVKVKILPQPWRTFGTIINKGLSGKVTGLDLLRLSRDSNSLGHHQKNVDYVRRSAKEKTEQAPKASFGKRIKSAAKVTRSGKKKQIAKGLETLSAIALSEAEQMKMAIERSKTQLHSSQPSGSGAHEGTGVSPGVPDVPTYGSDDERISWKSSDEEEDDDETNVSKDEDDDDQENDDDQDNDDDQGDDDEQTDSDNDDFFHLKFFTKKKQVEIGKCNMRIDPEMTPKEPIYQVVLDTLALTTCYPDFLITSSVLVIYMQQFWATINKHDSFYRFKIDKKRFSIDMEVFREILQICPRPPNQEFDALPSKEEIVSFLKDLGHTGNIKKITNMVVDHMHQPWRAFVAINKCLTGKITCLNKIRLLRAQILWKCTIKRTLTFKAALDSNSIPLLLSVVTSSFFSDTDTSGVSLICTPVVCILEGFFKETSFFTDTSGVSLICTPVVCILEGFFKETSFFTCAVFFLEVVSLGDLVIVLIKGEAVFLYIRFSFGVASQVANANKDDKEKDDVSDDGNDDDSDNDDGDNDSDDVRTEYDDDKNNDDQEEEYVHTLENFESTNDEDEHVEEEEYERIDEE